jgi:hypothetical protein
MACENSKKRSVCMKSFELNRNSGGESVNSRIIPDSKWTVWCYEKWKFAPKFGQLRKHNMENWCCIFK